MIHQMSHEYIKYNVARLLSRRKGRAICVIQTIITAVAVGVRVLASPVLPAVIQAILGYFAIEISFLYLIT